MGLGRSAQLCGKRLTDAGTANRVLYEAKSQASQYIEPVLDR